ncbi:ABC transporter permease [Erysipelotrichaceae bacterium RD49]|nr:ABC transporter permease [Erysipelotrichaceae bacterium RD49]
MTKFITILKKPVTGTLISIFFGFILAGVILAFAGYNPFSAFHALITGIIGRPKYLANIVVKSTPLILTGVSVAFAYKMGLFNIGAEGQYIVGALAANLVGIFVNLPAVLEIPLVIAAGVAAGALYGALVGWLKARFKIHEVISGIMLNWIALYFSNWVISLEGISKPNTSGAYPIFSSGWTTFLPEWKSTEAAADFMTNHPYLGDVLRTDFNGGFIFAIALAIIASFVLYRTTKGYQLRAVGDNTDAAEFAGIDVKKNIIHTMLISGAMAGLAGALNIAGNAPHAVMQLAAFEGNGLNGLSVAFIADGSPLGCIFSGFLFGGLLYAGQSIQYMIGAPSEIISILIGTIVFLVALKDVVIVLANKLEAREILKNKNNTQDKDKQVKGGVQPC